MSITRVQVKIEFEQKIDEKFLAVPLPDTPRQCYKMMTQICIFYEKNMYLYLYPFDPTLQRKNEISMISYNKKRTFCLKVKSNETTDSLPPLSNDVYVAMFFKFRVCASCI